MRAHRDAHPCPPSAPSGASTRQRRRRSKLRLARLAPCLLLCRCRRLCCAGWVITEGEILWATLFYSLLLG